VPAAVASDGGIVDYSAPAGTVGEGAAEHVPAAVASDEDLEGRFFSPVVLRIASERGVSMQQLASISGTGSRGRVTKADLLAWLEQGGASRTAAAAQAASPAMPAAAAQAAAPMAAPVPVAAGQGVEVIPMDNMRRLMAEHMVRSKQISPHVALVSEADLTRVVAFRDRHAEAFKAREGFSLTFMPFIADATVRALKEFPLLNASIDGTNILVKRFVNLGVAVALEHGGLIVPVVRGADALNPVGLARGIYDVASRARSRRLQPEEIQDGTFTITNFGVFGNVMGIPIINQPQVAILGVGALVKKPVVIERDGEDVIAIRRMVQLSLSFDHRLVDGALGGQFLQRVVQHLENFDLQSI
jgi:2-oxoglutarate dehydrogenase E2 component (dihydrolipoamide succinyltransferase)